MRLPNLSEPVQRMTISKPGTLTEPRTTVNLNYPEITGEKFRELLFDLRHGANYDAPSAYSMPVDSCGCHIFSGSSMAMCLSVCI